MMTYNDENHRNLTVLYVAGALFSTTPMEVPSKLACCSVMKTYNPKIQHCMFITVHNTFFQLHDWVI